MASPWWYWACVAVARVALMGVGIYTGNFIPNVKFFHFEVVFGVHPNHLRRTLHPDMFGRMWTYGRCRCCPLLLNSMLGVELGGILGTLEVWTKLVYGWDSGVSFQMFGNIVMCLLSIPSLCHHVLYLLYMVFFWGWSILCGCCANRSDAAGIDRLPMAKALTYVWS